MSGDERRKHIVIVDDNPVNLELAESVLQHEFKVTKLISGQQVLKFLNRVKPDLDVQMPEMTGFEALKEIRKNVNNKDIPVIFLTGQKDAASEREGLRLGAQDFIGKPFDGEVMLTRIRAQLELYEYRMNLEDVVQDKTKQVADLHRVITESWAEMVESRDGTTGSHVRNTTIYFRKFLEILKDIPKYSVQFNEEIIDELSWASTTHDIGKIGISDNVLKKPGPLTEDEMMDMQRHSGLGAGILEKIINSTTTDDDFLNYAREMALWHHERWDGTGYPEKLRGEAIPLYVQVLSIVDVYDALRSVRPYKRAFTHEEALEIIKNDSGKFFNPELIDLFIENEHDFNVLINRSAS